MVFHRFISTQAIGAQEDSMRALFETAELAGDPSDAYADELPARATSYVCNRAQLCRAFGKFLVRKIHAKLSCDECIKAWIKCRREVRLPINPESDTGFIITPKLKKMLRDRFRALRPGRR